MAGAPALGFSTFPDSWIADTLELGNRALRKPEPCYHYEAADPVPEHEHISYLTRNKAHRKLGRARRAPYPYFPNARKSDTPELSPSRGVERFVGFFGTADVAAKERPPVLLVVLVLHKMRRLRHFRGYVVDANQVFWVVHPCPVSCHSTMLY